MMYSDLNTLEALAVQAYDQVIHSHAESEVFVSTSFWTSTKQFNWKKGLQPNILNKKPSQDVT